MRLAIMQPYFMPYMGYFQLINAVDTFVFLDDVNYINKGWINRNNILVNDKAHLFTLPLNKASQNLLINEISLANDGKWREKLLRTFEMAYRRAPYFHEVFPMLESCVQFPEQNLSKYVANSIQTVSQFLGINTTFLFSSELEKTPDAKGEERILNICSLLKAETYINPIGGTELYNRETFKNLGIELFFLRSMEFEYRQFRFDFVPWLSVIDPLMFESPEGVKSGLKWFELV
jgi:hypothetical protein